MQNRTQEEVLEELSGWIRSELSELGKSVTWLSQNSGIPRETLFSALAGRRRFAYVEVLKIAHVLGKYPPGWNRVEKIAPGAERIQLLGYLSNTWRMKGLTMIGASSPLRPIDLGPHNKEMQFSYVVETGSCAGHYVICVEQRGLIDDDVVVIQETMRANLPGPSELVRMTLRRVSAAGEEIVLKAYDEGAELSDLKLSDANVEIRGLVVGFFIPVRRNR